ncbi:MAG: hypothetical protein VW257_08170 [Quisquiliibacterium sp.]
MRPFLVTEAQAGKLPRWGLLLLTLLYVIPGFVGRDPWRHDDAAGFGIALTMARGEASDWLTPNLFLFGSLQQLPVCCRGSRNMS